MSDRELFISHCVEMLFREIFFVSEKTLAAFCRKLKLALNVLDKCVSVRGSPKDTCSLEIRIEVTTQRKCRVRRKHIPQLPHTVLPFDQ